MGPLGRRPPRIGATAALFAWHVAWSVARYAARPVAWYVAPRPKWTTAPGPLCD